MPMTTLEDRRKALLERLQELDRRMRGIEDLLQSHDTRDWGDLATEREEDEVQERLGTGGQVEARMIRAALKRMDDGEYGTCARCGEAILPERLDAVPYTPLCRKCAGASARG